MSDDNVITINRLRVKTVDPDRVAECVDHINFYGFGYVDCPYCMERSLIAEQAFDFVIKNMIEKGRLKKLDWSGLDLSLVFEEALGRVIDIEQAISPKTTRSSRTGSSRESSGGNSETSEASSSIGEGKSETPEES